VKANLQEEGGGIQAALPEMADRDDGAVPGDFGEPSFELTERDQNGFGQVPFRVLPGLADVQDNRPWPTLQAPPGRFNVNPDGRRRSPARIPHELIVREGRKVGRGRRVNNA